MVDLHKTYGIVPVMTASPFLGVVGCHGGGPAVLQDHVRIVRPSKKILNLYSRSIIVVYARFRISIDAIKSLRDHQLVFKRGGTI